MDMEAEMARAKLKYLPRPKEIKVALAEAETTVTRMAKDLGFSRSYLQQCIGGHRTSPTIPGMVAAYLKRDVKELFFEVDLRNPDCFKQSHAA